jgi:hypothetical protein
MVSPVSKGILNLIRVEDSFIENNLEETGK